MTQNKPLNIDVVVDGTTIRIDPEARAEFAKIWGLDDLIPGRFSAMLVVDLMMHYKLNRVDPRHVIDEIKRLENPATSGITKAATPFTRSPLHPLWHQHYFSEHFVAENIRLELKMPGRWEELFASALGPEGSRVNSDKLRHLVEQTIEGSIAKRSDEERLTGEWIVFSKQKLGNIYLCMAKHKSGDQAIFDKMKYACSQEFPEIEPFRSSRP